MKLGDFAMKAPRRSGSAVLALSGVDDESAARSVRSALTLIRGVRAVQISLAQRQARVAFDPETVQPWQLHRAVQAVGCDAELQTPSKA
ncbi:MAG TPA: heavy metal-associated domain-containing protein [Burkholderiales bacterium]|nr:heavy metal-associated domain-containing protein [Burkholderiales bacterium]